MSGKAAIVVATVAASSFLPQARVLARSLARYHPGLRLEALRIDSPPGDNEPFAETGIDEIEFPGLQRFGFGTGSVGAAIAAKPHFIAHLLRRGAERVLFLDADTWVMATLDPLLERVAAHDVVLTPHRLRPAEGERTFELDLRALRTGTYNGGVVAFSSAARAFVDWWCGRTIERFSHDVARGFHGDQRWLDLAPGFVEKLHVHRDPGVNVAHWNLDERPICVRDGEIRAGDAACRLFHWSGFDPDRPDRLSRHSPLALAVLPDVERLAGRYVEELETAGLRTGGSDVEPWSRFADGTPIPDPARSLHDELGGAAGVFGDPFASGPGSFLEWLREAEPRAAGITRLWWAVYERRPDVRAAIPEPLTSHRQAFLDWCRTSGAVEHSIPPAFPVLAPGVPG